MPPSSSSTLESETPEETERRKAEELAKLLADGFRREELSWTGGWREPTEEEWKKMSEGLPRGECTEREREAVRRTTERMKRGMWVIKHAGIERIIAERAAKEA